MAIPGIKNSLFGGLPPMELTYQTYSTDQNFPDFTMPSGISAGDLILVASHTWDQDASATIPVIYGTGFTGIASNVMWKYDYPSGTDVTSQLALSYKIADGTESGTSIGGFMNDQWDNGVCAVYRPSRPITSVVWKNENIQELQSTTSAYESLTENDSIDLEVPLTDAATIIWANHANADYSNRFVGGILRDTSNTNLTSDLSEQNIDLSVDFLYKAPFESEDVNFYFTLRRVAMQIIGYLEVR